MARRVQEPYQPQSTAPGVRTFGGAAGGPFKTDLGAAIGNVATAIERGAVRRSERKDKQRRQEAELRKLQAGNQFLRELSDRRAAGGFDGMSAAEVQAWGDQRIGELAVKVAEVDQTYAETFKATSLATLGTFTAGQQEKEARQAREALLAEHQLAEDNYKSLYHEQMKVLADPGRRGEHEAAWTLLQRLDADQEERIGLLDEQNQAKERLDLEGFRRMARFDAGREHAVQTGTVLQFYGLIDRHEDFVGDRENGVRYTRDVSPEVISAARQVDLGRAAGLQRQKDARRAAAEALVAAQRADWLRKAKADVVDGRRSIEDVLGEADGNADQVAWEDVSTWFNQRSAAENTRLQEQMNDSPSLQARTDVLILAAGTAESVTEVNAMTDDLALENLSEDQRTAVKAALDNRRTSIEESDRIYTASQRDRRDLVKQEFKALHARLGIIPGMPTMGLPANVEKKDLAFLLRAEPEAARMLEDMEATPDQVSTYVRTVVEPMMRLTKVRREVEDDVLESQTPEWYTPEWRGMPSVEVPEHFYDQRTGAEQAWDVMTFGLGGVSYEEDQERQRRVAQAAAAVRAVGIRKDHLDDVRDAHQQLGKAADTLVRAGVEITPEGWFTAALGPELRGYAAFDDTGQLDEFQTLENLDMAEGVDPLKAMWLFDQLFLPIDEAAQKLKGWQSPVDRAQEVDRWRKARGLDQ